MPKARGGSSYTSLMSKLYDGSIKFEDIYTPLYGNEKGELANALHQYRVKSNRERAKAGLEYVDLIGGYDSNREISLNLPQKFYSEQGIYFPEIIKHYIENGIDKSYSVMDMGGIIVVKYRDKYIVKEGHHRIAASLLTGKRSVTVNLIDLDSE